MLAMIDKFQSRTPPVPIDGVGFQMHINHEWPSKETIAAAVDEIVQRGLKIKFSEVDVSVNQNEQNNLFTDQLALQQRQKFREVAEVYASIPAAYQGGITIWGVGDATTWIRFVFNRSDWPLLLDDDYRPKPAFYGFVEGLGH